MASIMRSNELKSTFLILVFLVFGCARGAMSGRKVETRVKPPDVVELLFSRKAEDAKKVEGILLSDDRESVRLALALIRAVEDDRFNQALFSLATRPKSPHRRRALDALLAISPVLARKLAAAYCADVRVPEASRLAFVELAGELRSAESFLLLATLLDHADGGVKEKALSILMSATGAAAGPTSKEWTSWIESNLKPDLSGYLARRLDQIRKVRAAYDRKYSDLEKRYVAVAKADIVRKSSPNDLKAYLEDPSWEVQLAALERIRALKLKTLSKDVVGLVDSVRPELRLGALETLRTLGANNYDRLAIRVLSRDKAALVRVEAARYLGLSKSSVARASLVNAVLNDEETQVRSAALLALADGKWPEATRLSLQLLESPEPVVREAAVTALGRMGGTSAVEPLVKMLQDRNARVRYAAADSLGQIGSPKALDALVKALSDPETSVAQAAVDALARIGDERAIEPLQTLMSSKDAALARQAWQTVLALCSRKPPKLLELAEKLAERKRRENALEALERLKKIAGPNSPKHDAKLMMKASRLYLKLDMNDRALGLMRLTAVSDIADAEIWLGYTRILEQTGKSGDLWEAYNVALGRFPKKADTWWQGKLRLVERLINAGDSEKAGQFIDEIQTGNPASLPTSFAPKLEALKARLAKSASKPVKK